MFTGNIKVIITDLDGTLISNELANYRAYKKTLFDYGIDLTESLYKNVFGLRFDKMIQNVAPKIDPKKYIEIKEKKAKYYKENCHLIVLNENLMHFLRYAKTQDIKICLATTASKNNALMLLEYFKLNKFFNFTVFGEDVNEGKPNPECYNLCINSCQVNPKEVLIFEDSPTGLAAAKSSGANIFHVRKI